MEKSAAADERLGPGRLLLEAEGSAASGRFRTATGAATGGSDAGRASRLASAACAWVCLPPRAEDERLAAFLALKREKLSISFKICDCRQRKAQFESGA